MFFARKSHKPPAMTLEGVLGPNSRIDEATGITVQAPDALCVAGDGRLLFSSGNSVHSLRVWGAEPDIWATFDRPVTALAASPGGLVAVGLAGGELLVRDAAGGALDWILSSGFSSIADCTFLSEDEIAVVDNGYGAGENVLSVAPWDEASKGRVVAVGRDGKARVLAGDLHCPMGIVREAGGGLLVTLLERAAVVDMAGTARRSGFPGYLGRIRKAGSGYVMACLSRRDPLIEFLKTEPGFVAEMKQKIDPRHWLSPRGSPEFSHDFPIELGATRLFGEIKPWAPSFSYGLVIELDDQLMPTGAAHSRANGRRHAISDVCAWNGDLIAVSRASGELLNLGPAGHAP